VTRATRAATALLIAVVAGAPAARSATTTYTTQAAFASAIADLGTNADADFDGFLDGTVIPSGTTTGGVTFTYSIGDNLQMVVVTSYSTTSGQNSLGLVNDLVFLAGDGFSIEFPSSTAVGLYVIGEDILPGDILLQAPVGEIANGDAEQQLSDGAYAFFLGIVESDPQLAFTSATITSFPVEAVGDYVWNVDDVTAAPEPGALAAGAAAALCLALGTALAAPKGRCTRSASTSRTAKVPRSRGSQPPRGSSARP
jgi:hypothetical protein